MSQKHQPNILLIMPDQMRGDCLSLAQHPVLLTPNIDEIGGQGAFFTHAYTTCASCIPARRALLTGQYPATNGMVGYLEGVPITTATLPQLLQEGGYTTAIAGRYMHQSPYETSYGYGTRVLGSTYKPDDDYARMLDTAAPEFGGIRGLGLSFNGWQARPWPLAEDLHPTHWTVQQARRLIRECAIDRPLFLTTSFYAPHPPLCPPRFYMERYLSQALPPAAIGTWAVPPEDNGIGAGVDAHKVCLPREALRTAQAGYYGLIHHIDDQIYWLLQEFKSRSRETGRRWVVVFTSDHGEMLGDHHFYRKCQPYEGASHIPFLIQGSPEMGFKSGLRNDSPVCLEDLMPTLLAFAGLPVPDRIDGEDLTPVLRGDATVQRLWLHGEHAPCYSEAQAYHFLTDGARKYIWRPLDGTEQFFDIEKDPLELCDLARDRAYAPAVAIWRQRLVDHLRSRPEGFSDGRRLIAGRPYPPYHPPR
ncbi:MAG: sulfatase-like hydrolase/transferase [Anaerolineae bacterium]|nr:sulfatase-like hydrolase/transferase [Anaerolineae bacterium]